MRKEKMLEKQFSSFFHYFEKKVQYRIERSPVITGDLKIIIIILAFIIVRVVEQNQTHVFIQVKV